MILVLIFGLVLLAAAGLHFSRQVFASERERELALRRIRSRGTAAHSVSVASEWRTASEYLSRFYLRVTRTRSLEGVQDRILRAGYAGKLSAEAFIAIQILAGLAGVALGAWLGNGTGAVLLAIVFGALGLYLPHFALSRAGRNRTTQIEQQLPHFVDQLAIAVEAGMSLDGALSYLLKLTKGPLADEMNLMMGELRVGEARRIALRHMVDRTGSEDVGLLVNAIINSDQRGVPLGGILRAQASDLRHRRQTSAEERAQKAPVKMLFPIVIFILPVMFVVIIGPALINIHNYL